jgi:hypothetical protein
MTEARVKTVRLIVHGKKKLLEQAKEKLVAKGFQRIRLQPASLKRCGNKGDSVAVVWPLVRLRRSLLVRSGGLARVKFRT